MKKFIALLLSALMLLNAAAALAEEPVTIKLWHRWSGANEEILSKMVQEFEAANPNVKVEITAKAGEYFELLQSMIADAAAGNDLPDVFIGGYNLMNYIATELSPVSVDQLAPSPEAYQELLSHFKDSTLPLGQWDGVQVGLPIACSTMVMYVNLDILAAAGLTEADIPTTWEELTAVCQTVQDKTDFYGVGIQFPDNWADQALVFSAGGNFLAEDGQHVDFSNEGMLQALTMWQSFYAKGYAPLCTNNELMADFTAGNVAMYLTSIMSLPGMNEYCNFNLSVQQTPSFEGKPKQLPVGGAAMISFSDTQAEKDGVWTFLNYFATEGVKTFVSTGYVNPTTTEVEIQPGQQAAYDQMNAIRPWECWPGGSAGLEIETNWLNTRTDIIQGGLDVAQTLKTLEEESNALLDF